MIAGSQLAQWIARWRSAASALALLGSICLNVAFASYIAVQALTASSRPMVRTMPVEEMGTPDDVIAKFAARLPSGDADILWEVYQTRRLQILDADAAAENARVRALSVLARHDLDASALRAAFKEAMEGRTRRAGLLAETVADALARISSDGRRQLTSQIHLR
jgi:Heavy-metal resistance